MNNAMFDLMASRAARPGTVEDIWNIWIYDNRHRLEQAIRDLGLEPPPVGNRLVPRIKEVVLPVLVKMESERRKAKNADSSQAETAV